ncbi:hypothetical protein [Roseomonas genomospecies 6]|uniref:hypothetical protein n=1 Tax=Roseomonas genomospecies 6 TaxID=214106 RepID=UPI0011F1F20A|nr:hypothetical protein [Roseomonas genomospecies 6]
MIGVDASFLSINTSVLRGYHEMEIHSASYGGTAEIFEQSTGFGIMLPVVMLLCVDDARRRL